MKTMRLKLPPSSRNRRTRKAEGIAALLFLFDELKLSSREELGNLLAHLVYDYSILTFWRAAVLDLFATKRRRMDQIDFLLKRPHLLHLRIMDVRAIYNLEDQGTFREFEETSSFLGDVLAVRALELEVGRNNENF